MSTRIRNETNISVLEILEEQSDKQTANFPTSNIADLHTDYHGPSPYHLNYCGCEQCPPGFQFGPSVRRSYLLHLVTKGRGTYSVGEKTYDLSAGQIFLIYPGDTTVYKADLEDPWQYFWIGFSGYQAGYILSQLGFTTESHVIRLGDLTPLTDCIREMLQTHQINLANELARGSLLLRFFSLAVRQVPAANTGAPLHSKSTYAKLTMQYLTNHYMNRIRISDIAGYIGVDRSHLSKCFHSEYQMSPQDYLLGLRMRKAAELLLHSDEPVARVADRCGYPDPLAFTKMFRKYHGMSPTDYRRQNP